MKRFVLDTNVVLTDPLAPLAFENNEVVIPFKVLEELDNIKSRKADLARDARAAIRTFKEILSEETTYEQISSTGVSLNKTHKHLPEEAKLTVITVAYLRSVGKITSAHEELLSTGVPDDEIIVVALATDSVLVTRDVNMRIKAMSYGAKVQDYRKDIAVQDADHIHIGQHEYEGSIWDLAAQLGSDVQSGKAGQRSYQFIENNIAEHLPTLCVGDYLYDHAGVLLVYEGIAEYNDTDHKFFKEGVEYLAFEDIGQPVAMNRKVWDLTPKNLTQAMFIDAIMNPNVHLVTALGKAGTGKTLAAVATSLELIMERKRYKRLIYAKSPQSGFETQGFLPGSLMEKNIPGAGPLFDSLEYLHRDDRTPKENIEMLFEKGVIELMGLEYIRGRSLNDCILLIDESQNFSRQQLVTILSRAGQNTCVILMGNLRQLDNTSLSAVSSGLTYTTEMVKDWEGARTVELQGVVRSELAAFVEDNF